MPEENVFAVLQSLLREIDATFARIREEFPAEVRCRPGCVDCCHACFDVSLIEAVFIRRHLASCAGGEAGRREILGRARAAQADIEARLAALPPRLSRSELLGELSRWRVRCPLLTNEQGCALYPFRPVTCRAYGLPTAFGGEGHVCGFSGFVSGKTYPTIKLDTIASHLEGLSRQLPASRTGRAAGRRRFFIHEALLLDL